MKLAIVTLSVAACGGGASPIPATSPAPTAAAAPSPAGSSVPRSTPTAPSSADRGADSRPALPLPPIPLVEGALAPRLVYPTPGQHIGVRDSNFVFGTVGNGHATLTINGAPVTVAPNGAFLAYLPVPPSASPEYVLLASV
ncbi:MAG TPA: hypothetical protein VHV78_15470, partial [Gemmatimonadaceae bacterium]|nr:hypothetical protein [Gemmatimonadaceae bacterium]